MYKPCLHATRFDNGGYYDNIICAKLYVLYRGYIIRTCSTSQTVIYAITYYKKILITIYLALRQKSEVYDITPLPSTLGLSGTSPDQSYITFSDGYPRKAPQIFSGTEGR